MQKPELSLLVSLCFFSFLSPFIFTPPISPPLQIEEVTEPVVETTTPSTTTSTTSSSSTTTTTTGSSTPITSSPSLSPSATAQASAAAVLVNTSRLDSSHFLVDGSGNVTGCAGCLCNCTSQTSLEHHSESSTQRHLPIPTVGWFLFVSFYVLFWSCSFLVQCLS